MPRKSIQQNINTYRVFHEDAYNWPAPKKSSAKIENQDDRSKVDRNQRKQLKSKFLYGNVATLNRPVPFVRTCSPSGRLIDDSEWFYHHSITKNKKNEQCSSLSERNDHETPKSTTLDSYNDRAFFLHERRPICKREHIAEGIVPVTPAWPKDGKQRYWNEKISFEHMYDARRSDYHPIRGRRQGAFVWEPASAEVGQIVLKRLTKSALDEETNHMTEGAAAMQGWADGLAQPPERTAHYRQFSSHKYPIDDRERLHQIDKVATLIQPDLYKSNRITVGPIPLFTR